MDSLRIRRLSYYLCRTESLRFVTKEKDNGVGQGKQILLFPNVDHFVFTNRYLN